MKKNRVTDGFLSINIVIAYAFAIILFILVFFNVVQENQKFIVLGFVLTYISLGSSLLYTKRTSDKLSKYHSEVTKNLSNLNKKIEELKPKKKKSIRG